MQRASLASAATRAWLIASRAATLPILSASLSADEQGYYFTLYSLMALQVFVEMGAGPAIVQAVSHTWALVPDGDVRTARPSDAARSALAGELRFVLGLYSKLALGFAALLLGVGFAMFGWRTDASQVSWFGPLVSLSVACGVFLVVQGVQYFLEGCNQVDFVYANDFWRQFLGTFGAWAVLFAGGALWSLPAQVALSAVVGVVWLAARYRRFLLDLLRVPAPPRPQHWAFQRRVALTWIADSIVQMVPNPLAFHFAGAAAAGRLGMSIAVARTVTTSGYMIMAPRFPSLGRLAALGDRDGKDRLFRRVVRDGLVINVAGAAAVVAVLALLDGRFASFTSRLLAPGAIALLLSAGVARTVVQFTAVYFRAHKQEPAAVRMFAAALVTAFAMTMGGYLSGVNGILAVYVASAFVVEIPVMTSVYLPWRSGRLRVAGVASPVA